MNHISLNSTSLTRYLKNKFKLEIKRKHISPYLVNDAEIIEELNAFGINTMEELDILMNTKVNLKGIKKQNSLSILRIYMIKSDLEKYFEKSWNNHWGGISASSFEIYKNNNIDLNKMINEHKIHILPELLDV